MYKIICSVYYFIVIPNSNYLHLPACPAKKETQRVTETRVAGSSMSGQIHLLSVIGGCLASGESWGVYGQSQQSRLTGLCLCEMCITTMHICITNSQLFTTLRHWFIFTLRGSCDLCYTNEESRRCIGV
jgi:hypothetical protein